MKIYSYTSALNHNEQGKRPSSQSLQFGDDQWNIAHRKINPKLSALFKTVPCNLHPLIQGFIAAELKKPVITLEEAQTCPQLQQAGQVLEDLSPTIHRCHKPTSCIVKAPPIIPSIHLTVEPHINGFEIKRHYPTPEKLNGEKPSWQHITASAVQGLWVTGTCIPLVGSRISIIGQTHPTHHWQNKHQKATISANTGNLLFAEQPCAKVGQLRITTPQGNGMFFTLLQKDPQNPVINIATGNLKNSRIQTLPLFES